MNTKKSRRSKANLQRIKLNGILRSRLNVEVCGTCFTIWTNVVRVFRLNCCIRTYGSFFVLAHSLNVCVRVCVCCVYASPPIQLPAYRSAYSNTNGSSANIKQQNRRYLISHTQNEIIKYWAKKWERERRNNGPWILLSWSNSKSNYEREFHFGYWTRSFFFISIAQSVMWYQKPHNYTRNRMRLLANVETVHWTKCTYEMTTWAAFFTLSVALLATNLNCSPFLPECQSNSRAVFVNKVVQNEMTLIWLRLFMELNRDL